MYGIEVRESGTGLLVELWGEFDVFCIEELRSVLDHVSSRQGPVMVDLSGITFLDLRSGLELAVLSILRPRCPTYLCPSPQVTATMAALGLEGWPAIPPDTGRDEPRIFSDVS